MSIKLDGKICAASIKQELRTKIGDTADRPNLVIITVGDDPASMVYVNQKLKTGAECNIGTTWIHMDEDSTETDIIEMIEHYNEEKYIHGIILQLPLPEHLRANTSYIISYISPFKDVDGLTKNSLFNPCTPLGIITLLQRNNISVAGKDVTIVGRSDLVGRPLARMLTDMDATVTLCHSKTKNLFYHAKMADIFVSAIGKPWYFNDDNMGNWPCEVMIDVGITRTEEGLRGDIHPNYSEQAEFYTPVPGGVGPMTVAALMMNTCEAWQLQI